ncbi:MAG: hypothetical protein RR382_05355 [Tannerellaceae bacterium]
MPRSKKEQDDQNIEQPTGGIPNQNPEPIPTGQPQPETGTDESEEGAA